MINYDGQLYNFIVLNYSWGKCHDDEPHWAHYYIYSQEEWDYIRREYYDEQMKLWWTHSYYYSVRCRYCRKYSPLRAQLSMSLYSKLNVKEYVFGKLFGRNKIDYHPTDKWPEYLDHVVDNGWSYIFFKSTGTDSLFGNGTFQVNLKKLEKVRNEKIQT